MRPQNIRLRKGYIGFYSKHDIIEIRGIKYHVQAVSPKGHSLTVVPYA